MALSRRFGIIQSLGLTKDEDDETCEEYHLLQKLLGKNTLFPCPPDIIGVSNSGDNKDNGKSDSEDEKVDPLWRVEFRNILRKCKQRQAILNKDGLFSAYTRSGGDKKSQGRTEHINCDGILKEKLIIGENEKSDDEEMCNVQKPSKEEFDECVKDNLIVEDMNKENVKINDFTILSEENEINKSDIASPQIENTKAKAIKCDEKRDTKKSKSTDCEHNSSESREASVEQQLTSQTKLHRATDKPSQKDSYPKILNNSTKANKKVKPVVKVIPSIYFPLDELLPKSEIKQIENPSKDTDIIETTNVVTTTKFMDNTSTSNLQPYNSHLQSFMSPIQDEGAVFHGEVYDSPVIEDFEPYRVNRSESIDCDNTHFTNSESTRSLNAFQTGESVRSDSLDNFSFIMDAIHNGNDTFVEQLQNVLSKQNKGRPINQQEHYSNDGNSVENVDNYFSSSYSADDFGDNHFNAHERVGEGNTRREEVKNQEGNLLLIKEDSQSNQLFRLFVDQCSQLVKTDEDRQMLASLVKLLKRESGSELFSTTGFTPPPTPSRQTASDRICTPLKSEAEVELFEGRTLLKGGVPPRHIPKTSIIKTGNDRPMDPRPISTMLSKPKPKPLPLPKFIYEMHDRSVIQRILTLDWDCKTSLYLDDNSGIQTDSESTIAYNPSKDLQNLCARSGSTRASPIQVLSTENENSHQRKVNQDVLDETTPLKDELRRDLNERTKASGDALSLNNSVYGKCKTLIETETFVGESNLRALKDKISVLIQETYNKSAKRGLFCDLNESNDVKGIKKKMESQDKHEPNSNDLGQELPFNNKIPVINSVSSNSYDFKSLVKTDSFFGSLDKLSCPTSTGTHDISPPFDSNNNLDSNLFDKHTTQSDTNYQCQDQQQSSLAMINVENKCYRSENNSDNDLSQSIPVFLSTTEAFNTVSESIEYQNEYNSTSVQSIPVHVGLIGRDAESTSPRGVFTDNNVVISNTNSQICNTNNQICTENQNSVLNISDDVREEGEVTSDLDEVIVINDESEEGKVGKRNTASKSVKEKNVKISSENKKKCIRNKPENAKQESSHVTRNKSDSNKSCTNENNNKKRKITATAVRLSYDFDHQYESDNSDILDGKRKKRGDSVETIRLPHNAKSRHIREPTRHSSCSSVESIRVNDERRESSNHRHRHKSTMSSTRSPAEVRSSTPSLSRSRSNSSDKSRHSRSQSHSKSDKVKKPCSQSLSNKDNIRLSSRQTDSKGERSSQSRSRSNSFTDNSKHSRTVSISQTDTCISKHLGSLSNSNKDKSKHSSINNESNTVKSRHSSSQSHSRPESSSGHRKRHHTVHDEGQSSSEKRSRLETVGAKISKRRHSDDYKIWHSSKQSKEANRSNDKRSRLLYDDILSPEYVQNDESENFSKVTKQLNAENNKINGKPATYEDILSPDTSGLSDELLSEEYQRLFGKKKDMEQTSAEVKTDNDKSKQIHRSIFSKVLPDKVLNKSLEDDMKFLESYKQKVQKKETAPIATVVDNKTEKSLDLKQELEDRKFLQMCKKKKEEKAKQSFEEQIKAYKKDK